MKSNDFCQSNTQPSVVILVAALLERVCHVLEDNGNHEPL